MKKPKINNIGAFLLAFMSMISAHGQEAVTYTSFLRSVRENNPLSQKAANMLSYAEFQQKAARGGFDPQLNSAVENKQFNSYHYFTNGSAELKQPLYTSQFLKVGYQYGQGAYLNPEKATPAAGLPYVGVEAALLQGLVFDKRRADVIKSKHYVDFYTAEQKIQLNDLLFAASNAYIDALYTTKTNALYRYFTSLADQRLKGITDLSSIGERPTVDTIEAAIFLQSRTLDMQAGEMEMIKRMNDIQTLSPSALVRNPDDLKLADSLEQVYYSALKASQQLLTAESAVNPIIFQYRAKQNILDTEKRLKREMIKPTLNVGYNFLSNANADNNSTLLNNYKWNATFSFPLFLRRPRNEYRMAALDARNNALETVNKENQIKFKRAYILEAIQLTASQIANAERSARYSKLLVEAERLKFTNGESSLFILNSRENKWLETEVKLAEYRQKFLKSLLELTYINGDLNYEFAQEK